jgi:hypothetical protein
VLGCHVLHVTHQLQGKVQKLRDWNLQGRLLVQAVLR